MKFKLEGRQSFKRGEEKEEWYEEGRRRVKVEWNKEGRVWPHCKNDDDQREIKEKKE